MGSKPKSDTSPVKENGKETETEKQEAAFDKQNIMCFQQQQMICWLEREFSWREAKTTGQHSKVEWWRKSKKNTHPSTGSSQNTIWKTMDQWKVGNYQE